MAVDFHAVALSAVERGFAIIPLQPGSKDPDYTLVPKINGEPGTGGACRRTRDLKKIAAWAECSPNANVGVCSDDIITILESDNEQQFRQLVRDTSFTLFGEARELPSTLTSQARPNRPHFFFRATDKTRAVSGAPGIQGLFEWRRENQYVVGPGSLHPTGVHYCIVNDAPIVEMPNWLVDVLLEIRQAYRGEDSAVSRFVRVGPAAIARDALLNTYGLDPYAMLADESFQMTVDAGERHYFLGSMAGLLHDGNRDYEELKAILLQLRDKYCVAGKGDYEVENLARWTLAQPPSSLEPNNLPSHYDKSTMTVYADPLDYSKAVGYKYASVPGRTKEYTLEAKKKFDGWFPRGRPSLVAGSSGSGKSTLMLDLLFRQHSRQYVMGHRGAGLRYLVLFADRGHLANLETLERLGLDEANLPIDYLSPVWGESAVRAIKDAIENYDENNLPQAVFVEGGDMLVEDPNKAPCVAEFMVGLQKLAAHYHIAIILSVGAPKISKQNAPTARRDMVFGSQMWSRNADTVVVISTDGDGTSGMRKLTVQHRNEATEEFDLMFKDGHLIEAPKVVEEKNDILLEWIESVGEFTRKQAESAMKEAESDMSRATIHRRIKDLVDSGKLVKKVKDNKEWLCVPTQEEE